MGAGSPPDIAALEAALDAAERDARLLVAGLTEERGTWRSETGSWSVAECLDHLATANRVYMSAMQGPAGEALTRGRRRTGPAVPGVVGGWFVRSLEPPVKRLLKGRSPKKIRPRPSPPLGDAFAQFLASQDDVRGFLRRYGDIDLAHVRFPNPFIRGIAFSLATGLHVIAAHERRHLWQAWRVRDQASQAL